MANVEPWKYSMSSKMEKRLMKRDICKEFEEFAGGAGGMSQRKLLIIFILILLSKLGYATEIRLNVDCVVVVGTTGQTTGNFKNYSIT